MDKFGTLSSPPVDWQSFDLIETIEIGPSNDSPILHTRIWRAERLIAWLWGESQCQGHEESCTVKTSWETSDDELDYWRLGTSAPPIAAIASTRSNRTLRLDGSIDWTDAFQRSALPGATLDVEFSVSDSVLSTSGRTTWQLSIADGMLADVHVATRSETPDLVISGPLEPIVRWVAGDLLVRDIADQIEVDGDIMRLGTLAAAMGLGRTSPNADILEIGKVWSYLVAGHRSIRKSILSVVVDGR